MIQGSPKFLQESRRDLSGPEKCCLPPELSLAVSLEIHGEEAVLPKKTPKSSYLFDRGGELNRAEVMRRGQESLP